MSSVLDVYYLSVLNIWTMNCYSGGMHRLNSLLSQKGEIASHFPPLPQCQYWKCVVAHPPLGSFLKFSSCFSLKDFCDFKIPTSSKVRKLLAIIEILDRPIAARLADWWRRLGYIIGAISSLFNYLLSLDEWYQKYCFAPAFSNKGSHMYSDIILI